MSDYRFTKNEEIYTLTVKELDGNFKIAAGTTPDWAIEYGGVNGIQPGKSYSCTAGKHGASAADMNMAEKIANAVIKFDKKEKTIEINRDGAEVAGKDLYLAGTINRWNSSAPEYKFTQGNDGIYTLDLKSLSGDFKIVTSDWEYQFGCVSTIEYGVEYPCIRDNSGSNISLVESVGADITIIFNVGKMTLEIIGMPTLYLVGDFNQWTVSPLYEFSYDNKTYTLTTRDFSGRFKITDSRKTLVFGSGKTEPFILNHNHAVEEVGPDDDNCISYDGLSGRTTEPYIRLTLKTDGKPDITTSSAEITEDDSPIEYFNLQGIRICHPTNGIYIRKQGTKIEKTIIR